VTTNCDNNLLFRTLPFNFVSSIEWRFSFDRWAFFNCTILSLLVKFESIVLDLCLQKRSNVFVQSSLNRRSDLPEVCFVCCLDGEGSTLDDKRLSSDFERSLLLFVLSCCILLSLRTCNCRRCGFTCSEVGLCFCVVFWVVLVFVLLLLLFKLVLCVE